MSSNLTVQWGGWGVEMLTSGRDVVACTSMEAVCRDVLTGEGKLQEALSFVVQYFAS